MKGAPTYAKWSTVRSPYDAGPRFVLPIGFRQSTHIASLVLLQSPVFDAIERARANGVLVSVYLDDIIGSHGDQAVLTTAYEDIRQSCVDGNLVPNPQKLLPPGAAITVFNCDLTKGAANVTPARIGKFFATPHDAHSADSFAAYITRVSRANQAPTD